MFRNYCLLLLLLSATIISKQIKICNNNFGGVHEKRKDSDGCEGRRREALADRGARRPHELADEECERILRLIDELAAEREGA